MLLIGSFNTQPPEGGCKQGGNARHTKHRFQHTATRRWLLNNCVNRIFNFSVSTHSHPKVAASPGRAMFLLIGSFNTQPPEGGCDRQQLGVAVSTEFQHTATRRWLQSPQLHQTHRLEFQHTATRRWLLGSIPAPNLLTIVSTHSHPKVAANIAQQSTPTDKFQHTATRRWLLWRHYQS